MSLHKMILNHVKDMPLSLAELQTLTQVSLPTLRKAIQELSDNHWIRVIGQSESSGGRPANLFGLDDQYYAIVSVHLQLPGIRMITSNLRGDILDEVVMYKHLVPQPREALREIESYLTDINKQFAERQILGIGIASPGYIEPETGNILSIGRVQGWHNFPICEQLRTASGLPVYIANDVDCMAFAEFQQTRISLDQNLLYIGFDEGIKVSMFLNNQLYKGAFGNVGLIRSELFGATSDVNDEDILTIHGFNTLFDAWFDHLDEQAQRPYQDIKDIEDSRQRMQHILEAGTLSEEGICYDLTQMLLTELARSILVTTYLIHPDMLVLGGILSRIPHTLFQQLEITTYDALPTLLANHLVIRQAQLSEPNCAALGASYHFLQTYLFDEITDPLAMPIVY